ncbi:thiamine pyrophosphate-binding protein [Pectobacterium actinidiae]|uniref:Thiamine pyrophosphate-binding protein n=1 Tax=Pectobacterium actinidiae TaxID=1507808 RepID=A0A1V2QYU1_9GAMM|nr:thiamine pyrophosphate-binding protein [Pectobacterium actinidiae]KHN92495.1 thiamine pyrophosphate protein TPP binding domain-containing protein [Pectobacterium actinidiae]ONK01087.1 thiamine pyrophosphate-binding protein [Pectobacterium actinidiae]ONK01703.1 thiamine pyrophosphate-binding protein [Pectobacterium actinidiae]
MIRVADYVMKRLYLEGVEHLFMVTGRGVLYLSDAAAKQEGLDCICVHHEQAGAYAAMAYSQVNHKMGACLVSTGCASTNAITPVLCAWQDDVPMVVISGQNSLKETVTYTGLPIRTYGQQEADIISLVTPITKYAVMVSDPESIAMELDKAFHLALSGRKGPVWIDIPLDIQNMRVDEDELKRLEFNEDKLSASDGDIEYLLEALAASERPVILIGSGVRSAGAEAVLDSVVDKYSIPVVYTASATDIYKSDKKLSIGAVGTMATNRAANFAMQNADLLIIVGSRMTSMTTGNNPDKFARCAKIIAIDIDENEYKKDNLTVDKLILSDAKDFLNKLSSKNVNTSWSAWVDKCLHYKNIFPKCEDKYKLDGKVDLYYLADVLSAHLDNDAVFVTDSGLEELIMPTTISFKEQQKCLHPVSQGAMGYALPAAIGAYYSSGKQVVAVVGDGSIMMNLQELQTIRHNNLPIKILVINNNCYAVIRKRQVDLFRTRTVGTDADNGVSCPEFEKVANCFDIQYEFIENTHVVDQKIQEVLNREGPVLCEILSPEDQEYINTSYVRNMKGRFVQRPLEDQSPFLERELFLSEMIIDPIDQ